MRSVPLASLLATALVLAPAAAAARAWQGITPGQSTQEDVVTRFGEPTTRARRGSRVVLAYLGDQALPGTKQAQFHLGQDGAVEEITVFVATELDKDAIEGTYGKTPEKTFTDEFLPVWIYRAAGVTVYFGKDGAVQAITFSPGAARAAPRPAGAAPAAGPGAPAAPPPAAAARSKG